MSQEKNSSHDNAIGWVLLLVVIALLLVLLWYFQSQNIRNMVRYLRVGEMWVASHFVDTDEVVYMLPAKGKLPPQTLTYSQVYELAKITPKEKLNGTFMGILSQTALAPFRYVFTGILVLIGLWLLFNGPKSQYRKRYDINTLLKRQAGNFPYIEPFIKFNPSNQPPRAPGSPVPAELPLFAEALGPEEWVAYYDVPVPDGKLDEEAAARVFASTLGKPWRGPLHLPPYKQVLLAAFCLKAMRKRAESDLMLGEISKCWSPEGGLKLNSKLLRQARSILKNRDKIGKVISKCNQHAYENTALIRALLIAREEGGVLAPAQFVWLRGFDRTLWYPLNNLGRQAYHTEALGTMCHYKAEKLIQRPIPRPKMEDAVKTLAEYLASTNARPIPTLDYSASKKRAIKKVKGSA
ncbi:MAG: type IV secretion system protein [Micavibrio aeruginosavorus]|uniref:Type IV secretion system protein n=1 Tax=Micavibrio aeruginosavorus TaxID=349221 RepID=A0A2W5FQV7_9BACT|nr:MAG: type IV secretion system protein [Micavibrio aeruginosavorus]